MKKVISIICSIIGFVLALYGLFAGLQSIGAEGFGQLGIIFIMPSILALVIITLDFLITIDRIKKGLVYSWISTLLKIGIIALFIPSTIYDYKQEMQSNLSNLDFDLLVIGLLIVVAIPSIMNIFKLVNKKKSETI